MPIRSYSLGVTDRGEREKMEGKVIWVDYDKKTHTV